MSTYADILSSYEKWADEPTPVPRGWAQRRGFAFERMLSAVFTLENLDPHTSFRPDGEEVDGSLIVDGRTFLLEAKWWKTTLPASQLYAFKGKIDGKLAGTLGIVISHSGYADDAVDALSSGKGVNMVLFDAADLQAILHQQVTFTDALRQKLRYAAEYGQPFAPISPNTDEDAALNDGDEDAIGSRQQAVDVIVEGPSDEEGLRALLQTFSPRFGPRVAIWTALGQLNLAALGRDLTQRGHKDITIFLDVDGLESARVSEIAEAAQDSGANLIKFAPSFVGVLEIACDTDYYNAVPETSIPAKHARRMGRHADLKSLWRASPCLHDWWASREAAEAQTSGVFIASSAMSRQSNSID